MLAALRVQWAQSNDKVVRTIGTNAAAFARQHLAPRCAKLALRRLLSELARLDEERRERVATAPSRRGRGRRGPSPAWTCPSECTYDSEFVPGGAKSGVTRELSAP